MYFPSFNSPSFNEILSNVAYSLRLAVRSYIVWGVSFWEEIKFFFHNIRKIPWVICHFCESFKLYLSVQKFRKNLDKDRFQLLSLYLGVLALSACSVFISNVVLVESLPSLHVSSLSTIILYFTLPSDGNFIWLVCRFLLGIILLILLISVSIFLLFVKYVPLLSALFILFATPQFPIFILQIIKYFPLGGVLSLFLSLLNSYMLDRFDYVVLFYKFLGNLPLYKNSTFLMVPDVVAHLMTRWCQIPVYMLTIITILTSVNALLYRANSDRWGRIAETDDDVIRWKKAGLIAESEKTVLSQGASRLQNVSSTRKVKKSTGIKTISERKVNLYKKAKPKRKRKKK
ncbi:hypothetical protein [Bifidobacterium sp. SO1]|uniref:hypothetical protein n=1 Tax=Bifidobacterium sp. SO1 TaxID=2809029 RepID=UPI001BDC0883|nr:hypothetical protein [Bifidobacterium sp. SO1]MBT1161463.1 hypothetical protein [Bifidobacterium sp. SO1]